MLKSAQCEDRSSRPGRVASPFIVEAALTQLELPACDGHYLAAFLALAATSGQASAVGTARFALPRQLPSDGAVEQAAVLFGLLQCWEMCGQSACQMQVGFDDV